VPAPAAPTGQGRTFRHAAQSLIETGTGAACASTAAELTMHELVRATDAVLISAIEALLNSARIKHLVVDQNMSVLEGSIGIFPRRILVDEDELTMARRLLEDAGFGHELRPDRR
jgi:putative signal transducing protein